MKTKKVKTLLFTSGLSLKVLVHLISQKENSKIFASVSLLLEAEQGRGGLSWAGNQTGYSWCWNLSDSTGPGTS